jgi:SPW repeat-containing protein
MTPSGAAGRSIRGRAIARPRTLSNEADFAMPEQAAKPEAILDVIKLALAAGLFLSPWFLGFAAVAEASVNAWICGTVVAVVSIAAILAYAQWQQWICLTCGLWAAASPWVLGFHDTASIAVASNVIVGIAIAGFAAAELWLTRHPRQRVTA